MNRTMLSLLLLFSILPLTATAFDLFLGREFIDSDAAILYPKINTTYGGCAWGACFKIYQIPDRVGEEKTYFFFQCAESIMTGSSVKYCRISASVADLPNLKVNVEGNAAEVTLTGSYAAEFRDVLRNLESRRFLSSDRKIDLDCSIHQGQRCIVRFAR